MSHTKKKCGIFFLNKYNELLIIHPSANTYTRKKSLPNMWSIPKGEKYKDESIIEAAIREFNEETNLKVYENDLIYLGSTEYCSNHKKLHAFFVKDTTIERPKIECKSVCQIGKKIYPENNKYIWISIVDEDERNLLINNYLHNSQIKFIEDILKLIK